MARARHGHLALNGLVYVTLLFRTGQWRRIVPTSWSIFPKAWESAKICGSAQIPSIEHFQPYDALRSSCTSRSSSRSRLMIATGPIMSPRTLWVCQDAATARRPIHSLLGVLLLLRCHARCARLHRPRSTTSLFMMLGRKPQRHHGGTDSGRHHADHRRSSSPSRCGSAPPLLVCQICAAPSAGSGCHAAHSRANQTAGAPGEGAAKPIFPFHYGSTRARPTRNSPEYIAFAKTTSRTSASEWRPRRGETSFSIDQARRPWVKVRTLRCTCMQGWTGIAVGHPPQKDSSSRSHPSGARFT